MPRMGRAVLFKSEALLHKVNPTLEWDNYAMQIYFNQIVKKELPQHPIPEDYKIFVGIAAYRDLQLLSSLQALIKLAAHPEKLRIIILNQYNFDDEEDKKLVADVQAYIDELEKGPNAPSIVMVHVSHLDAKNCYHARYRIQKYYNGETYQLQLDSHFRTNKAWDTKLIKMLHNCDAGEFSVLTGYLRPFVSKDPKDGSSATYYVDGAVAAMSQDKWKDDGLPSWMGRTVEKNHKQIIRPFETSVAAGHFTFSHGHLLTAAGHDEAFEEYFM